MQLHNVATISCRSCRSTPSVTAGGISTEPRVAYSSDCFRLVVRALPDHKRKSADTPFGAKGKTPRRALVVKVIYMPVSTRRNPLDPEDRAREDDLSTVDHREEIPQEPPQLDTSSGAPRAGAGRSASLFDRMRASLGGVDASEVSDDQYFSAWQFIRIVATDPPSQLLRFCIHGKCDPRGLLFWYTGKSSTT